jgi:hypothetical protein
MRRLSPFLAIAILAACSPVTGPEPSLAPRPAEAIDPRVPIPDTFPTGTPDAALASQLDQLVGQVRTGAGPFQERLAVADRLAAAAGPISSESWVAAQGALSLLVEQNGVTTRAAADIDALAASRLQQQHWIRPADQAAITAAADEVAAIGEPQAAAIARIRDRLAR